MTKHIDQTLWMTDDRYLRTDHCSVVYAIIWKFIAEMHFRAPLVPHVLIDN